MAQRSPRRPGQPLPRWVAYSSLGVLAVGALFVTWLAVNTSGAENPEAGTVPRASVKPLQEEPEEPAPEPAPEVAPAPAMQRLLAVSADAGHLLRAQVGACPEPAGGLEVSFDSGVSWESGSLVNAGATRLLQLDGAIAGTDRLVAQNTACEVVQARSFVGGADWEPEEAGAAWYLDPVDAAVAHTPSGAQALPCQAVGFASHGSRAAALCSESAVTVSADGGASWSALAPIPNAAAVGVTPSGFIVASLGEAECVGVRTRSFDGSTLSEPGTCLDVTGAEGGNIALAGDDNVGYLWAGDAFVRSSELGRSWT